MSKLRYIRLSDKSKTYHIVSSWIEREKDDISKTYCGKTTTAKHEFPKEKKFKVCLICRKKISGKRKRDKK